MYIMCIHTLYSLDASLATKVAGLLGKGRISHKWLEILLYKKREVKREENVDGRSGKFHRPEHL